MQNQNDAFIIALIVSEINIRQTIVDNGSFVNKLYAKTLEIMEIKEKYLQP